MDSLKSLVLELSKPKNTEELINLIQGLFTKAEIEEFSQRIKIVKLLRQGVAQHEIAKQLGVGVATVSRGASEIKIGNFKYV